MNQENDKTITYKILETGEEITVRLTNGEVDADQGKISRISPVGVALNNKKAGEIVEVKSGQKKYQIQVLNVKKE
jgi:transcription elongation GreA/GreB family factor